MLILDVIERSYDERESARIESKEGRRITPGDRRFPAYAILDRRSKGISDMIEYLDHPNFDRFASFPRRSRSIFQMSKFVRRMTRREQLLPPCIVGGDLTKNVPESRRDGEKIRRGVGGERRFKIRERLKHRHDDLIDPVLDPTRRVVVSLLYDYRIVLRLKSTVERKRMRKWRTMGRKSTR